MNSLACLRWTAPALLCSVFTAASAPITYPNQAYTYWNGVVSPVPGAFNVKAVALEGPRGMAVTRDGRVISWGLPDYWVTNSILDDLTNAVSVGLNYTSAAALTADGRVIEIGGPSENPVVVTNAIAIDVSGQFGDDDLDYKLAVTRDGRVVVWGRYQDWHPPGAEVPGVVTAAGGWSHIVALRNDGTVVEWDTEFPPTVVAGLSNIVAVAAGGEHSVALKADGTVVAWGYNHFGQTNVPAGLSNVVAISAAEDHTLALKSDGTLVAWGRSYVPWQDLTPPTDLSNGVAIATSGTHNAVIAAIPGPPPIAYPNQAYSFRERQAFPVPGAYNVKAVAGEGTRIIAVTHDGRVVTSDFPPSWLADSVVDSLTDVVAVGLNYTGGAALTADGRVIEFGRPSEHPPVITNAIAIDVSGQFNDDDLDFKLAVTRDERVVVWGLYQDWHPPSADIPGVVAAAGGWSHIVALKGDGTVVEWDVNNPPAVVAGLSNIVAVAAGGEHSAALKADGTVVAWGANFFGQTDVPSGLSNVVAISAAEYHTLALKSDGTLVAWGRFYQGEDVTPPPNLTNVVAIATSASRDAVISVLAGPTLEIAPVASGTAQVTISLFGAPNTVYAIEGSADLVTWDQVQSVSSGRGRVSIEVPIGDATMRFFRAK